jgi:hypothetical protein
VFHIRDRYCTEQAVPSNTNRMWEMVVQNLGYVCESKNIGKELRLCA